MTENSNSPVAFIRWPDLIAEIPVGANTIRDMISRGEFPAPVPLGPRVVGFVRDEVEGWKRSRLADRAPLKSLS